MKFFVMHNHVSHALSPSLYLCSMEPSKFDISKWREHLITINLILEGLKLHLYILEPYPHQRPHSPSSSVPYFWGFLNNAPFLGFFSFFLCKQIHKVYLLTKCHNQQPIDSLFTVDASTPSLESMYCKAVFVFLFRNFQNLQKRTTTTTNHTTTSIYYDKVGKGSLFLVEICS